MNTNNTTIQLRLDKETKRKAQKTLDKMGLDFSSAIKLFLKNVIITQSIPFEIRTVNGFTVAQEKEMLKEAEHAIKYGKRYSDIKELHKDLITEAQNDIKKGRLHSQDKVLKEFL